MTWTYGGDPTANDRDEVRFLIGDTDTADELISDEEIAYFTSNYSDNILAAAYAAESLAAKFTRKADMAIGKLRIGASKQAENFNALAANLFDRARAGISVGGLTISGKEDLREDSDAVQPSFRRGIHDNPSNSDSDSPRYDPDA